MCVRCFSLHLVFMFIKAEFELKEDRYLLCFIQSFVTSFICSITKSAQSVLHQHNDNQIMGQAAAIKDQRKPFKVL